jgi:hypothetical protein
MRPAWRNPGPLVVAGLACLAAYVLRDVLFFGRAFFERDLLWIYFPAAEALVRALKEGVLPLRDATIGFGQALLGNPDAQALYPPAWLHLILLPDQAHSVMTFLHLLIGGSGAALWCSHISRSHWSGFFAGAFWLTSGPVLSMLNDWHHPAGLLWTPWVLLGFERVLAEPTLRKALVLGALFGMQILAGSPDMCAATLLLALIRLTCEGRGLSGGLPRRAAAILVSVGVAATLAAGLWMPTLEIVSTSRRAELPREIRTEWSIHPAVATELFAPTLITGLPLSREASNALIGRTAPFLASLFMGALALPLCVSGLLNSSVSKKHRMALGVGAILMVLGALGKHSPFYDAVIALLPPLALFRYPAKAMLPASLLLSILAGLGVRVVTGAERRVVTIVAILAAVVEGGLCLEASRWISPLLDPSAAHLAPSVISRVSSALGWSSAVLLALCGAILLGRLKMIRLCGALSVGLTLMIQHDLSPTIAREVIRFRPGYIPWLRDLEPSRLYAFPYTLYPDRLPEVFAPSPPISPEEFVVLVRSAIMAPVGGAFNLEYGFDLDQRGLLDRTLAGLTAYMNGPPPPAHFVRLLRLANVTRLVDFHPQVMEGLELERTIPLIRGRFLYVYSVSDAMPRAYAVSGARSRTLLESPAALLDPAFDPRAEILLVDGPPAPPTASFRASVAVVERRSDRAVLDATLNEKGYVVLLEGFLPGWHVTVDGEPAPLRRANAVFMAVEAPKGRHRVVFTYRPWTAMLGLGLSGLTALGLVLALAYLRWKSVEAAIPESPAVV